MAKKANADPFGQLKSLARVIDRAPRPGEDPIAFKRRLLAEFCRLLGGRIAPPPPRPHPARTVGADLSPRLSQTLACMLSGQSEKEAARSLGVSRHTVHVYVKALYRRFEVNSRSELLARFVSSDRIPA